MTRDRHDALVVPGDSSGALAFARTVIGMSVAAVVREQPKPLRDQVTGRSRGFAFVEMSTDEGAHKAIRELNEQEIGGRRLAVNEARPKPSRGGGGGYGGGSSRRHESGW